MSQIQILTITISKKIQQSTEKSATGNERMVSKKLALHKTSKKSNSQEVSDKQWGHFDEGPFGVHQITAETKSGKWHSILSCFSYLRTTMEDDP